LTACIRFAKLLKSLNFQCIARLNSKLFFCMKKLGQLFFLIAIKQECTGNQSAISSWSVMELSSETLSDEQETDQDQDGILSCPLLYNCQMTRLKQPVFIFAFELRCLSSTEISNGNETSSQFSPTPIPF